MVDDVKDITENAESKVSAEALDRARLARERREAEQRKRLDELRAHAAAAQAQREKRDEDRRRRQAEQRAKDDDRRQQVEERKRAIWEASVSRREALLQRERDRTERLERARAARSAPRPAFAFGSSTPRLLEPIDSAGFFWAARRAASTTNVMFASAPLTRRASALQLDSSDTDNKDEPDRSPQPQAWSSVARRRTDLVPTLPAPRAPGRAYSMTRLDRIPAQRPLHSASPSMHQLNRSQTRSGDTTPGSRPGSAMSNATGVVRRATSAPRKPRPASIAGTGVNTPRGGGDTGANSVASTPSVSRDATTVAGDVPRRAATTPRRARPLSLHATARPSPPAAPGEGKPPLHRKPKPSKDHDKTPRSKSPGRALSPSPSPVVSKDSVEKDTLHKQQMSSSLTDKNHVSAVEVSQKLEALQIDSSDHPPHPAQPHDDKAIENKENIDVNQETKHEEKQEEVREEEKQIEVQKPVEKVEKVEKKEEKVDKKEDKLEKREEKIEKREEKVEKREEKLEKKEPSQEKTEENEMTASMTGRRITTEEEAKAALAERRRRAREELERQAELERQRLQREAEEEAERQRQEEERQRREEEEARELAALQRRVEEEKLRKAIEAQQQLERSEAERRAREEEERAARAREEEERRRAADEAERLRREEAEREERERLARKQRVEAIMARTRLKKQAEEDKKKQESLQSQTAPPAEPAAAPSHPAPSVTAADNGNGNAAVGDLVQLATSQPEETKAAEETSVKAVPEPITEPSAVSNNGNVTADLLGLSETNDSEDNAGEQTLTTKQNDNANTNNTQQQQVQQMIETNNGNIHGPAPTTNVGHISANFIQTERLSSEHQTKMADKLLDDDFTTHNGHGAINHPLTLQNAI